MASPFAITVASNTVLLDSKRQGQTTFTVSNLSGRPLRVRARLVPQDTTTTPWLSLVGEAERDLPIAGTQQYVVQIAAPPSAPAGSNSFRLDVVGVDNPDEMFAQGPSVTFTVPAPEVKKPFPIWIPIVAVVVVLAIIIGVIIFIVTRPQPTFAGHWNTAFTNNPTTNQCSVDLTQNGNTVTGTYCVGTITGTVSSSNGTTVLTGNWRFQNVTSGPLSFFLVNSSSQQFQGNDVGQAWCGWRDGATPPAVCLRLVPTPTPPPP